MMKVFVYYLIVVCMLLSAKNAIAEVPTAHFTISPNIGQAPLTINLDATSSASQVTTYRWHIERDGLTPLAPTPLAGYPKETSAAIHQVTLPIEDFFKISLIVKNAEGIESTPTVQMVETISRYPLEQVLSINKDAFKGSSAAQFKGSASANEGVFEKNLVVTGNKPLVLAGRIDNDHAHTGQIADLLLVIGVEPPAATGPKYSGNEDTVYYAYDGVARRFFFVDLYVEQNKWSSELAKMTTAPFQKGLGL